MTDRPTLLSRLLRRTCIWHYRRQGWHSYGQPPADRRCVIIAVPHTSNWDFVNFIGLTEALGIRPRFMAKASLFRWPLGRFMRDMGGVSVDRTGGRNQVEAAVAEFARRDEFMLVIAPEGTRGATTQWKSGFYHIAMAAGVPIVCGAMDYARRSAGIGEPFMPTGDYAADMARLFATYERVTARHPERTINDLATIISPRLHSAG